MLVALAIFIGTLVLVIWQPRGLGVGWSAMSGAGLALLTGVVGLADIPTVWGFVWNATFTFVAVIIISLVLDEAGFFEWAALHVARWGKDSGRRLFVYLVLLGAAVAALFANDGAALILTPIVIAMLLALRFSPAATLAMLMWFCRRDIPVHYDASQLKDPRSAVVDRTTFNAGWAVLALLLVGFFGLERLGIPISAVAGAGALVLLAVAAKGHVISTRR